MNICKINSSLIIRKSISSSIIRSKSLVEKNESIDQCDSSDVRIPVVTVNIKKKSSIDFKPGLKRPSICIYFNNGIMIKENPNDLSMNNFAGRLRTASAKTRIWKKSKDSNEFKDSKGRKVVKNSQKENFVSVNIDPKIFSQKFAKIIKAPVFHPYRRLNSRNF